MLPEHDSPEPLPLAYGVRGAARAASVPDRTLRDAIAHGRLRTHKVGQEIVILRDDLQDWLATLSQGPASNGAPAHHPTVAGAAPPVTTKPPELPPRIAYDIREAAKAVCMHENSIRLAIAAGKLEARMLGRKYLIRHADLCAWVDRLPSTTADAETPNSQERRA